MKVRTRFAPSPTGYLHIGGARTALFNWLYAKHAEGEFVLRIEDTDEARNTQESIDIILNGLRWLGLEWDEGPMSGDPTATAQGENGPYFQSQRSAIYQRYVDELKATGHVYERDGAIRFKMPRDPITIPDLVVGDVVRKLTDREEQDPDFVIVRADGKPVFHLVNVVDDLEMGITHVIRGEDHLSNTSKHLALMSALGRTPPQYGHIPLILNANGSKMSKRDSGASIGTYIDDHFLPEAVVNYLCLLGWSPKNDSEVLPIKDVVKLFDLPNILRHNAKFDMDKLQWINGEYLSQLDSSRYAQLAQSAFESQGFSLHPFGSEYVYEAIATTQGKMRVLSELGSYAGFYFKGDDDIGYDPEMVEKHLVPANINSMQRLRQTFDESKAFDPDAIQAIFKQTAENMGVKIRTLVHPIRLACTGTTAGPSLYHLISILGKDSVIKRIDRAIAKVHEAT
ncbi:MAG: Glutamate--tRNA ligase 1 [Verrucomicrobia subdivision 3 bacterium]|nr:Glutamate--tRNA ligase 1 [Limisphaerales bacterium]MCS1415531.1 Glutamate--tRNA ligase 1 [Limisphaerales bacterium]